MAYGFNETMLPYAVINGLTTNVTGSWFLSFMVVLVLFIVLALALRIPIEFTSIFIFPLALVFMAFSGQFVTFGAVIIIYLGFLLARNFLF